MPIDDEPEIPFCEVHEIIVPHLGHVPIAKGDFTALPKKIQQFIAYYVSYLLTILLSVLVMLLAYFPR